MFRQQTKFFFAILLIGVFLFTPFFYVWADNETQAQLEQELKEIEQQIEQYTQELNKTQAQKVTLANKIKQLQMRQKALGLQIKETTLKLSSLNGQITVTKNNIQVSLDKEQQLHQEMAIILRKINSVNGSIILSLFASDGISSFFNQIQNYSQLTSALKEIQEQNRVVRGKLVAEQEKLDEQKVGVANLLQIKSIQQEGLKGTLGEQNQLLTETKGLENSYQSVLSDSKKRASEIRNRIYELFNTGKQIDFGQAVDMAKWVAGLTGIRPAFLLAILTQESNLGKNVGTCNRVGDPPTKSWKVIMKPDRDQNPFVQITKELGLDTDTTPVSCPMHDKQGNQIGWGGAMGPAQFIPSTWMGYKDRVSAMTGRSTANPWDIRDAFLAAAIKLKAGGADGTDKGDWAAAMRYFSGSTNIKYRFYGDNVLATTKQYLQDMAELQ